MPTGHRVHKLRSPRVALPKEVEPIGPGTYRDRFGVEYEVVWNGHRDGPYICGMLAASSNAEGTRPAQTHFHRGRS